MPGARITLMYLTLKEERNIKRRSEKATVGIMSVQDVYSIRSAFCFKALGQSKGWFKLVLVLVEQSEHGDRW